MPARERRRRSWACQRAIIDRTEVLLLSAVVGSLKSSRLHRSSRSRGKGNRRNARKLVSSQPGPGRDCESRLPVFVAQNARGFAHSHPAEWSWHPTRWKRHLKIFSQRFLRRWPSAGFIWKLEFQKRGAPHFHPFVWGLTDDQFGDFILWISAVWNEVVQGDANHFAAGTSVERMRSISAAVRYVSSYASKTDQTLSGQKVGRYWRVVGEANIPWGQAETLTLDQDAAKFILRTCRRYILSVNRQTRIRIVAKQLKLRPWELTSFGGWFECQPWQRPWGKHLRGDLCGFAGSQLRGLQSCLESVPPRVLATPLGRCQRCFCYPRCATRIRKMRMKLLSPSMEKASSWQFR
jgi:hypothetical protein